MLRIKTIVWFIIMLLIISSCKVFEGSGTTKKKEEEVKVNCYAADYKTTLDHFRTTSSARDADEMIAQDKALLYAKKAVISSINSVVLATTARYIDQTALGQKKEFKEIFIPKVNAKVKEVLNSELTDYTVICQNTSKLEDGRYQSDISLEVNKRTIVDKINSRMSSSSGFSEFFDPIKFEQILNEELQKVIDREKAQQGNTLH